MSFGSLSDDMVDVVASTLDARSAVAFACTFRNAPRVCVPRRNPRLMAEIRKRLSWKFYFVQTLIDAGFEFEGGTPTSHDDDDPIEWDSIVDGLNVTHVWPIDWDGESEHD